MKRFILIFVITFLVKVSLGQICDLSQVLDLDRSQVELNIRVFGYADILSLPVTFNNRENAASLAYRVRDAFSRSKLNWISCHEIECHVEGKGSMLLYLSENNTNKVRKVVLRFAKNYLQILQLPAGAEPKVFTVSGPNITLEGISTPIVLSGSEAGVNYVLSYGGTALDTLAGTGTALTFQTKGKTGTYTITAKKGAIDRKMGELTVNSYSIVKANYRFSLKIHRMRPDGGIVNVAMIFPNKDARVYYKELKEIVDYYNQGKIAAWDTTMKIAVRGLIANENIILTIAAPLNTGETTIHSAFRLDENGDQFIHVMQSGKGVLTPYSFSGPEYVNAGEKYKLVLRHFQYGVSYLLYKDGVFLKTFTGKECTDLTGFGTYTMKATFKGETIDMVGTYTVRNKAEYSHYTKVTTYNDANTPVQDITYYDNLGRPVQQVSKAASPSGKDVITPIQYDESGRVTRSYLPYAIEGKGTLRKDALQEQSAFYKALYGPLHYAYSDIIYERSPRNQVINQSSPGESWSLSKRHTVHTTTSKNTAEQHIKRCISSGSSVLIMGEYPAGSLSVKNKLNQEKKLCREYHDNEGRLIAKERWISTSERYITFYVYNAAGRLSHIIPPALSRQIMAESAAYVVKKWTDLAKYCYYLEYDKYGNIYKQYVPGAGYTINLYDKRGRMVLSQNSVMRSKTPEEWAFTKYDIFNRPVISGVCNGTEADHTSALAAQTVFGEERGTVLHGYTNQTYPTAVTANRCLNVTYYDDYTWSGNNSASFSAADALGQVKSDDVKGKMTGQKTKVLGIATDQWLLSATYYDSRYCTIQEVSQLYPSGTEVTTNVPDYTGNITQVKVKQTIGSQTTEYHKYYSYDHRGRLLKVEQQMTGDTQGKVTLAEYTYDEMGRRQGKKLHNGLYDANYTYNVAGVMTGFSSRDLTWLLSYDELPVPSGNATAKYDGNISCLRWKNGNGAFRAYTYQYDGLGQLLQADYNEQSGTAWSNPSGKYNVGGLSYDDNGNLKTLVRKNASGSDLHNLGYHYDLADNGNALSSVTLNGSGSGAFVYDGNGNLTTDGERGINIRYNELNLPAEISKGSEKISYIYSASGEKLAMQAGSSLTYYRDVMVYNGNTLSYVLHPEGIVRRSGSAWVYDYMLTDHTGSTRVLLEASGNALSTVQNTDYYPFGLSFTNNNLDKNKYLFSGKEMQDGMLGGNMLGWYDFGARMYNPTLGRWFCQDPALQLMSPYGFCGNNPVSYVDEDGKFFIGYAMGFIRGLFKRRNPFKEGWKSAVNQEKIRLGLFRPSPYQKGIKKFTEIISRFTWQLPQVILGYGMSQIINFTSSTKVDFFGGATTISSNWFKGMEAMTSGNFINGSNKLKADPNTAPFQHEYGHYLQSREMGWAYLSKVGIPSILSAGGDGDHRYYPVEQDANARAIRYFNEKGVLEKWHFKYHPIGDASWNMDNIYKEGTREFTEAFNGVLNGVKTSPSFWDYFTFGIPPGILITGGINHNHNKHDSGAVK